MFNRAIRQYNRASALSQRRSSLKGEKTDVREEKNKQNKIPLPASLSPTGFFYYITRVFRVIVTKYE